MYYDSGTESSPLTQVLISLGLLAIAVLITYFCAYKIVALIVFAVTFIAILHIFVEDSSLLEDYASSCLVFYFLPPLLALLFFLVFLVIILPLDFISTRLLDFPIYSPRGVACALFCFASLLLPITFLVTKSSEKVKSLMRTASACAILVFIFCACAYVAAQSLYSLLF